MARVLVVANWKMNPRTAREARALFDATKKAAERASRAAVIVAPPSIFLRDLSARYRGRCVAFALQSASAQPEGPGTGEISLAQGKDARASYVLVAHAERRSLGETDEQAREKVAAALSASLTPILCVGEHSRDSGGAHFPFVAQQLRVGLSAVPLSKIAKVIVAYEPVWAIGAAVPMSARDMQEMAIFIRKTIVESHGQDGLKVKVLYGGAMDETNDRAMLAEGGIEGLLVGRASADPEHIAALLRTLS